MNLPIVTAKQGLPTEQEVHVYAQKGSARAGGGATIRRECSMTGRVVHCARNSGKMATVETVSGGWWGLVVVVVEVSGG